MPDEQNVATPTYQGTRHDIGGDIPSEEVPLPSSGKVYPLTSPLHGQETVSISAMTTREEDILTSKALLKKGTVITELIRSCLIDKTIDPADMLTGDRNTLMVAIRVTGYGQEYDAEVECTGCNTKSSQKFDLAQLPIQRLVLDPIADGVNAFEFLLPRTKKTVRFKFLTGKDEETISATVERAKKLQIATDTVVSTNLLYSIVSVDGTEDRAKIGDFVRKMPAQDSLALRNYIKSNEPGIILKQEVTCGHCGESDEVSMPIGTSFLWPSA